GARVAAARAVRRRTERGLAAGGRRAAIGEARRARPHHAADGRAVHVAACPGVRERAGRVAIAAVAHAGDRAFAAVVGVVVAALEAEVGAGRAGHGRAAAGRGAVLGGAGVTAAATVAHAVELGLAASVAVAIVEAGRAAGGDARPGRARLARVRDVALDVAGA